MIPSDPARERRIRTFLLSRQVCHFCDVAQARTGAAWQAAAITAAAPAIRWWAGAAIGHGAARMGEDSQEVESQPLSETVGNVLEEARMILPGTQTLFGFQLIVVFNARFHERLSPIEEYVHLGATVLVALATAMLIAPAAYHRRVEPESVSRQFVALASRLLSWSLIPLAIAICADFYLVASLVTANGLVSLALAAALLGVFVALWFVMPGRAVAKRRANASASHPQWHE